MKESREITFVFQARDIARPKVVHARAFLNFLNKILQKYVSFLFYFFRIIINAIILKQLVAEGDLNSGEESPRWLFANIPYSLQDPYW